MQNTNFTKPDLLADEVNVDLNVLGSAVMNEVSYHVYSTDAVTEDDRDGG
jgi:hypothetical protein